ncbi:hypothetical protein [Mycobacterium sp. OAE908]|uniref:hypothetical protein n=1 Tax=Mycobacterium sp. OAE908 TaxID=2817899 RepID=UPI001AE4582F
MSRSGSPTMKALHLVGEIGVFAAVVWLVVVRHIVAMSTDAEDAVNALACAALGGCFLLEAAGAPTLTRKVRDGWIGRTLIAGFRTFNGRHEKFVAKFRAGLVGWGSACLVCGVLSSGLLAAVLLVPGVRRGPQLQQPLSAAGGVFLGLTLITIGVVYLRCRRILATPAERA